MRGIPFFKGKNKPQFAGLNFSDGSSGGGDTSLLVNKSDITPIILTGTTNTSGNVISAGTWFYLNGKPCVAKADIASGATFTEGTNYEEKTVGSALSELNGKIDADISSDPHVIGFTNNIYTLLDTTIDSDALKNGYTYSQVVDGTGQYGANVWYLYQKSEWGGVAIVFSQNSSYSFVIGYRPTASYSNYQILYARRI